MNKSQKMMYTTLKILEKRKNASVAKIPPPPVSSIEAVIHWQKKEDEKTTSQEIPASPVPKN